MNEKQKRINRATAATVYRDLDNARKESVAEGSSEPYCCVFEDYQIYFITEDLPIGTMAFKGALAMDHKKQIMIDIYNGVIYVGSGEERVFHMFPPDCYDDIYEVFRCYYEGDLDNMSASW